MLEFDNNSHEKKVPVSLDLLDAIDHRSASKQPSASAMLPSQALPRCVTTLKLGWSALSCCRGDSCLMWPHGATFKHFASTLESVEVQAGLPDTRHAESEACIA